MYLLISSKPARTIQTVLAKGEGIKERGNGMKEKE